MYNFVTGPLVLVSFFIFFAGLFWRFIWYLRGLSWRIDRVSYKVNTLYGVKGAIRSIFYWLLPFGTRGWRFYPGFTVLVFTFHLGVLLTPFFVLGHNILLRDGIGINFWSIPDFFSDLMTVVVVVSSILIIMRRIALPEVRLLTSRYDIVIMLIAISPFVTGFLAFHQIGNYDFFIFLHVICGEILLISIPFTKLSHFLLFFLSRWQLGMDYGIKRGGMKNKGIAW